MKWSFQWSCCSCAVPISVALVPGSLLKYLVLAVPSSQPAQQSPATNDLPLSSVLVVCPMSPDWQPVALPAQLPAPTVQKDKLKLLYSVALQYFIIMNVNYINI